MQKKNIFPISNHFFFMLGALVLCLFGACEEKKNTEKIPLHDFVGEMIKYAEKPPTLEQFQALKKDYGSFFLRWQNEVMNLEHYSRAGDSIQYRLFLQLLETNRKPLQALKIHYAKYPHLQNEISEAFLTLHEKLPEVPVPAIYNYFSMFSNYTTFADTLKGKNLVAYSAEMFMDDTFILYKALEVEEFMNRYNGTRQIPAMLMWTYLKSQYETNTLGQKMVDEMAFSGKIWYTMEQAMPNAKPWDLFGYEESEWKLLNSDQGQIWRHYVTENMLFNSDFNKYKRYFTYGNNTFGSGIPEKYPPMIGFFTGYKMVQQLMANKKLSLTELWKIKDGAKLLQMSGYNPVK